MRPTAGHDPGRLGAWKEGDGSGYGRGRLRGLLGIVAALWMVATGCSSPPLVATPGRLVVQPSSLSFPLTWIGHSTELSVTMRNEGRSPLQGRIQVRGPFTIPADTFRLGGGEAKQLTIRFVPSEPGEWEGVVTIGDWEVLLAGTAAILEECPPSDLCRTVERDPLTGQCSETWEPDGTACRDACIDGVCIEGRCKGNTTDCDDGKICTSDVCDSVLGCVHHPSPERCESQGDPCSKGRCNENQDCVVDTLPEGTICGPSDCSHSMICTREGECVEVETPDGLACGEESPCRDPGRCDRGDCIQPLPHTLQPSWTRPAAPDMTLYFDGTSDPRGYLYWAECSERACDLLSVTASGTLRYKVRMFDGGELVSGGSLGIVGETLISTFMPGQIEARSTESGTGLWRTPLAGLVGLEGRSDLQIEPAAPMVIGNEHLILALAAVSRQERELVGGWVVGLSLETGELVWRHDEAADFVGMVGDESGNVVYTTRLPGAGAADRGEIVCRSETGEQRWRQSAAFRPPLLSLGGRALFAGGEMRHLSTGTPNGQLMLQQGFPRRSPLWSGDVGYAHGITLVECDDGLCPSWKPHLIRFDGRTGATVWSSFTGEDSLSEGVLTENLSLIVARTSQGGPVLRELTDDPELPVFECKLPPGRFDGRASLAGGYWVTVDSLRNQLVAFPLKDRRLADRGWAGPRGGGGTTGRPR